ncbi:MAG: hypothetical protein K2H91_11160 [Lachnospiraceae bacterium]|nr:hypothetical protein [Lachnospiraceae bacterium]
MEMIEEIRSNTDAALQDVLTKEQAVHWLGCRKKCFESNVAVFILKVCWNRYYPVE